MAVCEAVAVKDGLTVIPTSSVLVAVKDGLADGSSDGVSVKVNEAVGVSVSVSVGGGRGVKLGSGVGGSVGTGVKVGTSVGGDGSVAVSVGIAVGIGGSVVGASCALTVVETSSAAITRIRNERRRKNINHLRNYPDTNILLSINFTQPYHYRNCII